MIQFDEEQLSTVEKNQNRNSKHSGNRITPEEIEETLGLGLGRKITTRGKILYGFLMLTILALIVWSWNRITGTAVPVYIVEQAALGDLTLQVSATGNLQAVNTVEVGSEISGLIKSVYVDFNDHVAAGQLLAELDTDRLNAEVTQARAGLRGSEASLTQAQAGLEEQFQRTSRAERLAQQYLIAPQELEAERATLKRTEANVEAAHAQIEVSQAALNMTETILEKAFIRSPIDGVVLIRNIKPGQSVAASFQTPVLFSLAEDLTRMELIVDVDEADIGKIKQGQMAAFTVDAYPDSAFPAEITKIHYSPQNVAGVITYEAILSVDNSGMLLWPGMTATTDIVTNQLDNVLLVPSSALRFTPPGMSRDAETGPAVWTITDNQPVAIPVKTGLTDGRYTQIISGEIQPGQKILVNIQ